MPEAFLWHTFLSLARALRMMHFGTSPGEDPPEQWKSYLHCDIKPDNSKYMFTTTCYLLSSMTNSRIVLFKSRPEDELIHFPYPIVKLCDFGAAIAQGKTQHASTFEYDSPVSFVPRIQKHT